MRHNITVSMNNLNLVQCALECVGKKDLNYAIAALELLEERLTGQDDEKAMYEAFKAEFGSTFSEPDIAYRVFRAGWMAKKTPQMGGVQA